MSVEVDIIRHTNGWEVYSNGTLPSLGMRSCLMPESTESTHIERVKTIIETQSETVDSISASIPATFFVKSLDR